MNSTLKSLLFWMVLVVVGVLIWNFSHTFQKSPGEIPFSTFLDYVAEEKVVKVQIVGNRIKGTITGTNWKWERAVPHVRAEHVRRPAQPAPREEGRYRS